MKDSIVFVSPGSGMGHAVRATAIASILHKDFGENVTVVSNINDVVKNKLSYVTSNTVQFVQIPFTQYVQEIRGSLQSMVRTILTEAKAIIIDSFPYGLVGEWKYLLTSKEYSSTKFIYLARRMKWAEYLSAMGLSTLNPSPICTTRYTVMLEPLHYGHERWVTHSSHMIVKLDGPVHLPIDRLLIPTNDRLTRLVHDGAHLVVCSHTESEGERLYALAQEHAQEDENIIWVSPEPPSFVQNIHHWVNFFPISYYFPDALAIYGTGSYNIMAETIGYRHKYHAITFSRRYDVPEERQYLPQLTANGAYQAANFIHQVANDAFSSL